jgi:TonB-dependent receptor
MAHATAASAHAQVAQSTRFYDIPAQPLGTALNSYAEMTGIDLVAAPEAVSGKRSHALRGNYSPEDALDELLRGTSLSYHMSSAGSVIVGGGAKVYQVSMVQDAGVPPPAVDSETRASQEDQQTEPPQESAQEIVVTGVRASLERARDIKRNSSGVVDAVSAEEIGKFPDTNLAESLQRIPGVSIDRRNGEGARVTVRGFGPQFNLVTVNGRQLATTDVNVIGGDQNVDFSRANSRSFDFSNLSPDGVARLEVYKTGRAATPTGGIGATINVVTLRPLGGHESGLRGSIGAKAAYDTSNDGFKVTPEVSGVLSWSNPADSFGVTLFGAYQKRDSAAASSTVNDWNILTYQSFLNGTGGMYKAGVTQVNNAPSDPNELIAVANDSRYHYSVDRRETINGSATVEFKPIETLTITADGLYAQNKLSEQRSDQTNWFNRPFDTITFDGDPVVDTAVKMGEGSLYGTKDLGFEQQYRASKTTLYSAGLNAKWELGGGLTLNLDGNTSRSKSEPDAPNGATSTLVSFGAPVVNGHSVDFTGDVPQQNWILDDCLHGNCNNVLDIGDLGTQVQRTNSEHQTHRVNQFSADLGWNFGGGARFDVGGTYIDSNMTSSVSSTQQQLGDWGITKVGDVQQYAGDLVHQYCLQCEFDTFDPTNAQIAFRGNAIDLYKAFGAAYAANAVSTGTDNFDAVREKVMAAYAQLSWEGEIGGRKAGFVGGVRWENTKVNANALIALPTSVVWKSDNDFNVFSGATKQNFSRKGEYTNVLPSLDFRIEPADGLVARVSYSKTLARADYGFLFASQTAGAPNRPMYLGGVANGTSGNPDLKPLLSDNLDLSLEYYYGRSNYVSAGVFAKHVKNFVGIEQVKENLFGLTDPSSGAAGTVSGQAVSLITANNILMSDVTLFTMAALIQQHNGDTAAALAEFNSHYTASSNTLDQTFVDQVIAESDITGGPNDPLLMLSVATPVNNESANIHGFEIQGQHFFGDTGFGVAGSLTKVFGDIGFDRNSDPTANVFALTGLSDSANVTGIYEKYGISARVSYNWRGKFLSQLNRGGGHNPVYVEPFGTLDASVTYDVTRNAQITLEAQNILSEPIRTYARSTHELWFAQELHPRFWLGARYKFGGVGPALPPPPPPPVMAPPPPATQTCADGTVIDATAMCPAAPPPPPPAPAAPERG